MIDAGERAAKTWRRAALLASRRCSPVGSAREGRDPREGEREVEEGGRKERKGGRA